MKNFILIIAFLISYKAVFTQKIEEPDHFEQMNAKLLANVELKFKLSIFEKVNDVYVAAYFDRDDNFVFEEFDNLLNHKVVSKLKINNDEYLNSYLFDGNNVLLIFDSRKNGVYAKTVFYDYKVGKVINSEFVYNFVSPSDYNPSKWNKGLNYNVIENKEKISISDYYSNSFITKKFPETKTFFSKNNDFIIMYNFLECDNENLDVYYSIFDKTGKLVKCERTNLMEKAYDKYRIVKGLFVDLNESANPTFYVDYADKKQRFITAISKNQNEKTIITTPIPVIINGETDYTFKSLIKDESNFYIWGVISEEIDDFADAFGLIRLNLNLNEKKLNSELMIWNEDEVEKLTDDNKLTSNMISDIRFLNDDIYVIMESNEVYYVYEQNMYIPVNELRDAIILKIDKSFKVVWSHFIKNRDIKRIISCDNGSRVFNEPKNRYALKLDYFDSNNISFFYHDNKDDDIFGYKTINSNDGKLIKNSNLFESDEMLFLYPKRVFKNANQVIMQVSNDCDSHVVRFEF